jgi:hypothetical protein
MKESGSTRAATFKADVWRCLLELAASQGSATTLEVADACTDAGLSPYRRVMTELRVRQILGAWRRLGRVELVAAGDRNRQRGRRRYRPAEGLE